MPVGDQRPAGVSRHPPLAPEIAQLVRQRARPGLWSPSAWRPYQPRGHSIQMAPPDRRGPTRCWKSALTVRQVHPTAIEPA